jgi:hypothetical protein
MRKLMIVTAICMMTMGAGFGCSHNKSSSDSTTQSAIHDDCPMCPGVQTANADGTCPKCGMKVKG